MTEVVKGFDEDVFDRKVAREIIKIHKKKFNTDKYAEWVNDYLEHIERLHDLSETNCNIETFASFVYDNTEH